MKSLPGRHLNTPVPELVDPAPALTFQPKLEPPSPFWAELVDPAPAFTFQPKLEHPLPFLG
eukprot:37504-Chlamydomonas_euryale.AAC.4